MKNVKNVKNVKSVNCDLSLSCKSPILQDGISGLGMNSYEVVEIEGLRR